ncbi:MAG: VOC family protein [Sphingomonas bacterium]
MGDSLTFDDRSLDDAAFRNCAMSRSRFDDIRLADARFANVDLQRASFRNVNMADVSIDDANITGLTIMGHDVTALIRQHEVSPHGPDSDCSPNSMAAEPQLYVSDLDQACQFYVRKLGFDVMFSHGDPPFYAQIRRGGWRLNLRSVGGPVFDRGFRDREADALSATLTLSDARPIFQEWREAGADFHQALKAEAWGALTFIVRDPDGNLIAIAGRPR